MRRPRNPNIRWLHVAAFLLLAGPSYPVPIAAQTAPDADAVRSLIQRWKTDPRGPFQAIRWFCTDGRVQPPAEPCGPGGGQQHALLKDEARRLATQGVHLGQILAGTDPDQFLDEANGYARPIQYMLEKYLERTDDGWIRRRARFYRGAVQAEDEESWGRSFLRLVARRDALVRQRFYLVRELYRDIPHSENTRETSSIRAMAAELAGLYPSFMDLRVKIHGQPAPDDLQRVRAFSASHAARMGPESRQLIDRLITALAGYYGRAAAADLRTLSARIPTSQLRDLGERAASELSRGDTTSALATAAGLLLQIREQIEDGNAADRPVLFDVSLTLEEVVFRLSSSHPPVTIMDQLVRAHALAQAAAGTGWLERWEWRQIEERLVPPADERADITSGELRTRMEDIRRLVEWGSSMAKGVFGAEVDRFEAFEPLVTGFQDDRLRSSVLLHLGSVVARIGERLSAATGNANQLLGASSPEAARGMNAGFARGILTVIDGNPDGVAFQPDRIYVLARPPSEMKPVAGILSVSEGNVVSHVQLLARNLGIPNAVIAPVHVTDLKSHDGERVFLAVSPRGVVRLIADSDMTDEERALVDVRSRSEERITVPTDRLDLEHIRLDDLADLRATDSGRLCGPKAANLGQLASLFPGRVAPGFIIPFGMFRRHLDLAMPGRAESYWEFLESTFSRAAGLAERGVTQDSVDVFVLDRLSVLRTAIAVMPLDPVFLDSLRARFRDVFGTSMGETPVFVRSDTNMEDLKDFTGAGLNQTIPNVVREKDVLDAIRTVWSSPYRERSYRWRQRYLLNPEDVYPSILVLRSVDVDASGVMITTGIASGRPADNTVAFSRGVGGAVDGQMAETWLLAADMPGVRPVADSTDASAATDSAKPPVETRSTDTLLAPAREPSFRKLPTTGGVQTVRTGYSEPILDEPRRSALREVASEIRTVLPTMPGIETAGPFDVELGFVLDDVRLFQVRPFVENRNAASTTYLTRLDAAIDEAASTRLPLRNP